MNEYFIHDGEPIGVTGFKYKYEFIGNDYVKQLSDMAFIDILKSSTSGIYITEEMWDKLNPVTQREIESLAKK